MSRKKFFIIIFFIVSLNALPPFITAKNLPIVLVHGILADKYAMIPTKKYIKKYLPDTYVKSVCLGKGTLTSLFNMNDQVEWFKQALENDENLCDGCIIIAHSQGGLIARSFIEKYNDPHVYIYISWGTPQSGIFGSPGTIDQKFAWLQMIQQYAYKLLYSYFMQRLVSFAGYWKDPLHYDDYLNRCNFLPIINNEIDHADCALFKDNICSLKHMVLVQSTQEDVVDPAASCHFGFYPVDSNDSIQSMFDSEWYQSDKLGLKTLAESNRLHLKFAHCTHTNFQEDEYNFVENTLPYLRYEI